MPANLPPQYFGAEKTYRSAKTAEEKIAALEEMLAIMPKHKGTDHLHAELRAKIAKLNQTSGKKVAGHRASMVIPKEGAAQVVVTGPPNGGKSQLVARLTNASPTVADYPFTTHSATPGMMEFENIQIQLIDTPPLAPPSIDFWLPLMLRRADALLVILDLTNAPLAQMAAVIAELGKMRIVIMGEKPEEGEVFLYPQKALIVGNKIDLPGAGQNYAALRKKYQDQLPVMAISAREGTGLEELKRQIFEALAIMRVYTSFPGAKLT